MKDVKKEFFASSWAINNRTTIFVLTIMLTLMGLFTYNSIPKESFPEIIIPKIFINTIYPGTSPTNMENLVTKPLEKQVKSIAGVKKITSNSYQDYSVITVEFNTDVKIPQAKLKVKDAVDKAKSELPNDLPKEPSVMDINLSEIPILYVNISGDFDLNRLKRYADALKDSIETMKEITKAEIIGALDREIQINMDMNKMQAAQLSLGDIERTIGYENLTISAGTVKMEGTRRTLNVKKEFKSVDELRNLIVKTPTGASIYLRDLADIEDTFKEQQSYARLDGKNVITLSIVKRAGENLIQATDKIRALVDRMKKNSFPSSLKIVLTNDQSTQTRITLHDLINTIVIGFILVTVILMFFMGATNAIFVAMSVPLSMFLAFLIMPSIGFTMNMIVLFSFLMALGIVVDDAIVVIENTHRIYDHGKRNIVEAAKMAAGEVFLPVLSGTLTTLAPFIPLAFWKGVIGEFMFFLPITLIITLMASLVVAYIINPVFAVRFMKPYEDDGSGKRKWNRSVRITTIFFVAVGAIFYFSGLAQLFAKPTPEVSAEMHHEMAVNRFGLGNLTIFIWLLYLLHHFVLIRWIGKFQKNVWPKVIERYKRFLSWCLDRPGRILAGTFGLFIFSFVFFGMRGPKVVFFPHADPNFTYIYLSLPIGTDQAYTNEVLKTIEKRVDNILGKDNPLVSSVIANVTVGVTDPQDEDQGVYPNKGRISIAFVPYADRHGKSTQDIFDAIQKDLGANNITGAEVTVAQEQAGPPVSKPISIEITGDELPDLTKTATDLKKFLDEQHIDGVEELKSDFQSHKPEIVFDIDRERANREGISIGQIGQEIRKAVFGLDQYSKFRDADDEYPIQVRYKEDQRNNISALENIKITYRDMAMGGQIRQVPISSFAKIRYGDSPGSIKRKNQKRIIMLTSNVLSGYNPNEVVAKVQKAVLGYTAPDGVNIRFGGEQEEQAETAGFLGKALLISLFLIVLVLVMQFNSVSKPFIIITEIFFSIIGVLLGVALFKMDMSIVMTGVGIIALAGIVVRNGILLVEFADLMIEQGMSIREAIVEAGRTRMTPVLLTASATILGLIPLAVGLNLDFATLFTEFNPHLYLGGDSVAFWGPLSWTMIFGLGFATFLTLILVPVMYLLSDGIKKRSKLILEHLGLPSFWMYVPFFVLICRIFVKRSVYRQE